MTVTRAIVRALALAAMTAAMFAMLIAGLLLTFSSRRVAARWRSIALRRWARFACSILGVRVRSSGPAPSAPFVLVANHLSYVDILVMASRLDCAFIAKSEVARWPVIGLLCRSVGTIFIDRSSRKDVARVNSLMAETVMAGRGVVLFPEGTSSNGVSVLPFRSSLLEGAVTATLPVHCAALSYRVKAGDPPAQQSVCWWGDMTFGRHFVGLLRLKEIRALLTFAAEPVQGHNRKALAHQLWSVVNRHFVPVVGPTGIVDSGRQQAEPFRGQYLSVRGSGEKCNTATN